MISRHTRAKLSIGNAVSYPPYSPSLVVLHIRSSGVELQVALDDLVYRSQEVLLGSDLMYIR